jgi:hypothetical protein
LVIAAARASNSVSFWGGTLSLNTQFFASSTQFFSSNAQVLVACIALFSVTLIFTVSVFFATLRYWVALILRCDSKLQEHINPIMTESRIFWKVDLEDYELPWPFGPLEWVSAASLSAILIEIVLFGREPGVHILWYVAAASAAIIAFSIPFIVRHLWTENVRKLVRMRLIALITPRHSAERDITKEIFGLWYEISDSFTAIGAKPGLNTVKVCRYILLRRAVGGATNGDTLRRLIATRKALASYVEELRCWKCIRETALQEFEWAENAVMINGSAALLDELTRIRECLNSDNLADSLSRGSWDETHQLLGQIRIDLKTVRNLAESESKVPNSVEEAYRLLNVNSATSYKVIKTIVDALRRVWHPDLTSSRHEREKRTAKMQQINAAWDMIVQQQGVNRESRGHPNSDRPEDVSTDRVQEAEMSASGT